MSTRIFKRTGKVGVMVCLFALLFVLAAVFHLLPAARQSAAVGDALGSGERVSIEGLNWRKEGDMWVMELLDEWGEVYYTIPLPPKTELSDDNTSLPAPPSTSFDSLTDETIFDILSLDLKVNGSDGPVEVGKGERIVVSWASEGASRCRAIWSKKDIALSGTTAGRLARSGTVTIRAACIDTEGERVNDSVVVRVRDMSELQ